MTPPEPSSRFFQSEGDGSRQQPFQGAGQSSLWGQCFQFGQVDVPFPVPFNTGDMAGTDYGDNLFTRRTPDFLTEVLISFIN